MITKVGLVRSQGVRALQRNSTERCYGRKQYKEFRHSTYAGNPPTQLQVTSADFLAVYIPVTYLGRWVVPYASIKLTAIYAGLTEHFLRPM